MQAENESIKEAWRVLQKVFGYTQFRKAQAAVIERLLGGKHTLLIMPTGGGKSLCYQIPALVFARRGAKLAMGRRPLTVVLSPLIALMKDQVDALLARDVAATFVNSSLDAEERRRRYQALANGQFDLLYVTPERFRKADFLAALAQRKVVLLAVDEAHCISQWGHDFRPDYTRVGEIRTLLGDPTTLALTATATRAVQIDIAAQLGLELRGPFTPDENSAWPATENVHLTSRRAALIPSDSSELDRVIACFHEGIERPNLTLAVREVWSMEDKLTRIREVFARHSGCGIIYFTLIKTLEEFSRFFDAQRLPHLVYHGELPQTARRRIQERFTDEPEWLVLATNAFGMGIDKPDIRFVIHADLPGSLESYYQEIGRAGRDGQPAECLLLYDQADLATQMEFIRWSNPDEDFYARLHDLLEHEMEAINSFGLEWLREKLHARARHDRRLETALGMFERYGVLRGSARPLRIEGVRPLPAALCDGPALADKLARDQRRLFDLVQFVRYEGHRGRFLREYFLGDSAPPANA